MKDNYLNSYFSATYSEFFEIPIIDKNTNLDVVKNIPNLNTSEYFFQIPFLNHSLTPLIEYLPDNEIYCTSTTEIFRCLDYNENKDSDKSQTYFYFFIMLPFAYILTIIALIIIYIRYKKIQNNYDKLTLDLTENSRELNCLKSDARLEMDRENYIPENNDILNLSNFEIESS